MILVLENNFFLYLISHLLIALSDLYDLNILIMALWEKKKKKKKHNKLALLPLNYLISQV